MIIKLGREYKLPSLHYYGKHLIVFQSGQYVSQNHNAVYAQSDTGLFAHLTPSL